MKLEQTPRRISKEKSDDKHTDKNAADRSNKAYEGELPISMDQAKNLALDEFPGTVESVDLDREDGLFVYEVEIETEDGEVEVEIDAYIQVRS